MNKIRWSLLALLLAAACAAGEDDDLAGTSSEIGGGPHKLRVMTRNMYVGGDVDPIMTAPPDVVPFLVAEAYATMQSTRIDERAEALAEEIHDHHADLVGLQEVSLIRLQDPGDLVFGGTTPATFVAYDFLQILLDALEARGLHYRVVAQVEDTDAEVPMITAAFSFVDVRLTDHDVILARDDVDTTLVAAQSYAAYLPLPSGVAVRRGYVAVDANVDGTTYRFVSTHLEDGFLDVQLGQTQELIATLAGHTGPLVVVGDFNSHAPAGDSYRMMLAAGYADAWTATRHDQPGFTCCQRADLRNRRSTLSSRIDFVFSRNLGRAKVKARITGIDEKTDSGLWASDHAGVAVTFAK